MTQTLPEVEPLLATMAKQLAAILDSNATPPLLVGILTGGLWVARRLAQHLPQSGPIGEIDIGFHRDDFHARGLQTPIRPTRLQGPIENRRVVLVDDVLHTGRTVRAAINAIFEYGRPESIVLAILVARDGRQLPIQADVLGTTLTLPRQQRLKLDGPDPLRLRLEAKPDG